MLALTSPTSGGCSVDIVHSRTKATEFFFYVTAASSGYFPSTQSSKLAHAHTFTIHTPTSSVLPCRKSQSGYWLSAQTVMATGQMLTE
jgi:hypothetical protein